MKVIVGQMSVDQNNVHMKVGLWDKMEFRTFPLNFFSDSPDFNKQICVNRFWTDEKTFTNLKMD